MGEVLKEVDLNEVLKNNPAAFEELKSVYSVYAHYDNLPLVLREARTEQPISKVFLDGRIIIAKDINGHPLLLVNPEEDRLGFNIYYSDVFDDNTWEKGKKTKIPVSSIANNSQFKAKMAALDDTTRMQQITEKSKRAFSKSAKVGGKVIKVTSDAGRKAAPFAKKGLLELGRTAINIIKEIDPDKYYDSGR